MKSLKLNERIFSRLVLCAIPLLVILAWLVTNALVNRTLLSQEGGVYTRSKGLRQVVYIQPVGEIDNATLDSIRELLKASLKHKVEILPDIQVPYFPEGRVDQLKADFIRNHIIKEQRLPNDTYRILIITNEDLYTDGYNFIFGQASTGGIDAVISTNRLIAAGDGGELISDTGILHPEIYYERIRKLVRHELGHTFGLPHCKDQQCVMSFHASLYELDEGGEYFCDKCLQKLTETGILVR